MLMQLLENVAGAYSAYDSSTSELGGQGWKKVCSHGGYCGILKLKHRLACFIPARLWTFYHSSSRSALLATAWQQMII